MTHICLTDYNYNWFLLESESLSRRNNQTWRRWSTASNIPPLNLEHTFFRYKHMFANIRKTQELSTPWSRHCLDAAHLLVSRSQDISALQLRTSVRLTHICSWAEPQACLIIPTTHCGDGCSHNVSCITYSIKKTGEIKRLLYVLWTWNILVYFNEMTCLFWMLLLILGAFWRNVCVALSRLEALWNNGWISHGVWCIIYQLKQHFQILHIWICFHSSHSPG